MMFLRPLAFIGLWLVSSAIAGSSESFNVATEELKHIDFLTANLTDSINAWDGKDFVKALNNIHYPTNATAEYILNATEVLKQYPTTFDITQAFRIGSPAQNLAYTVNASVATLARRKHDFHANAMDSIVITDLKGLLNATRGFSGLLTSYVTKEVRPVAKNIQVQFIKSLQQGVDCFGGKNASCHTAIADPNRTHKLALKYNAMKPNGYPIV